MMEKLKESNEKKTGSDSERYVLVQMGCIDFADLLLWDGFPRPCQFDHCGGVHQTVTERVRHSPADTVF